MVPLQRSKDPTGKLLGILWREVGHAGNNSSVNSHRGLRVSLQQVWNLSNVVIWDVGERETGGLDVLSMSRSLKIKNEWR